MLYRPLFSGILLGLLLMGIPSAGLSAHLDQIGLTALRAELGGSTPTGAGISISQIESPLGAGLYAAVATDPELTGKTFTLKSGVSSESSHATFVARSYGGSTNGPAPGITQIDAYEVNSWLQSGFLRWSNSSAAPLVESRRLQNHSWIGSLGSPAGDQDAVRRLDFAIQRDGFVAIVGLNNMNTNPVPALFGHSYNAISIGVPAGNHSSGGTTFDVAGRIKPEIVVPSDYYAVSFSCGVASGAAALLLQTADASPALVNARTNSEVIKALLLAGATKTPFPTWTRSTTQPLDLVYGAGQLNIQKSYHLLKAGEFAPSSSVTVSNRGWDFASTSASAARYFFDVPAGYALTNFSAIVTWNRSVTDVGPGMAFTMQASVADLNLRLHHATNFTLGPLLDGSLSTIQNVEHVYTNLPAGRYALEVTSDTTGIDYALAWGGTALAQVTTSVNQPAWGNVSPASGNYPVGNPVTFVATPAPYFLFSNWSGSLMMTNNSVPLTLTSNMTVTAIFAERFTTNHPTPYWWLASFGYTSNQETVINNLGANGFPLWQSYVAGLTPTNPASQLRFTSQSVLGTNLILAWNTITGRVYTLWTSTNAATGFAPLAGAVNLPATAQTFTNPIAPTTTPKFFRLQVQLP
jgi:hypothetical protein